MPTRAHAEPTVNIGAASEFGRGLGAGVELGSDITLVAGAGAGLGFSSVESWIISPGIALGVRGHLGGWYLGPSLGLNYYFSELRGGDAAVVSALMDVGYAWKLGAGDDLPVRLGLGLGAQTYVGDDRRFDLTPTAALTLSFGWGG